MTQRKNGGKGSRARDIRENFGGDTVKAEATARLERDGTATGVHIHFGVGSVVNAEILDAWRSKKYGFATIKALAVNYGKALDAGTMLAGKNCGECGDYTPGDIDSLEKLETLVHSAVEYALTRPITKDEAGDSVSSAIAELEKQASMNSRLDFSDVVERLNALKAKNIGMAFDNGNADFRGVMVEADEIVQVVQTRVIENLTAGCRELASDLGPEMVEKVEAEIVKALALPERYMTIGALASCRKTLRANGAKYREQREKEQASQNRGGRQFTPRTGRGQGRGTHGGGGRFRSHGAQSSY